jgi:hypothetical protein
MSCALRLSAGEGIERSADFEFFSANSSHSNVKSSALDLHFSREDMIDKFLFASVTGNGELSPLVLALLDAELNRPLSQTSNTLRCSSSSIAASLDHSTSSPNSSNASTLSLVGSRRILFSLDSLR